MSTFNDKHLLWWVFEWMYDVKLNDTPLLEKINQADIDFLVEYSDVPKKEKEKYKTWIWNAFECRRKIFQEEGG